MKSLSYALAVILSTSATASEKIPFYQERGYTLENVTEHNRSEALEPLGLNREFRRMQGLTKSCETIYHLADPGGQSVGYGSICKTGHEYLKAFFCWDASGQHFGYANKRSKADSDWMGDSILIGCGGVLVSVPDYRDQIDDYEMIATPDGWAMPEVGWGETRPVYTMLHSDIERLGFDLDIRCPQIHLISLGLEGNDYYGAICKIDKSDNTALICFDNLAENLALFTRHQDTSKWTEYTIYRFCWND